MYKWLEFIDWRWPPAAGALQDQPESLMDDLRKIKWLIATVRKQQQTASGRPAPMIGE